MERGYRGFQGVEEERVGGEMKYLLQDFAGPPACKTPLDEQQIKICSCHQLV